MKRSPMPPRKTRLQSSSPIARKRRTKAEQAEKFADDYGSEARREWVANLPCLVCGRAPCENAHTWNRGKGRKGPPESIVPLCPRHHRESHRGVRSFEALHRQILYGFTLVEWAGHVERLWQREQSEPKPLSAIVLKVYADILNNQGESQCAS